MNFLILGNSYGGEGEGAVKKEPKIYFTGRMWPPSEKERSRIWKPPCRDLSTLVDSSTWPTSTERHRIFARTVMATLIIVVLMATLNSCPGTGLCPVSFCVGLYVCLSLCLAFCVFPSVFLILIHQRILVPFYFKRITEGTFS